VLGRHGHLSSKPPIFSENYFIPNSFGFTKKGPYISFKYLLGLPEKVTCYKVYFENDLEDYILPKSEDL